MNFILAAVAGPALFLGVFGNNGAKWTAVTVTTMTRCPAYLVE